MNTLSAINKPSAAPTVEDVATSVQTTLLDEAILTQMANAFFAALPGQIPDINDTITHLSQQTTTHSQTKDDTSAQNAASNSSALNSRQTSATSVNPLEYVAPHHISLPEHSSTNSNTVDFYFISAANERPQFDIEPSLIDQAAITTQYTQEKTDLKHAPPSTDEYSAKGFSYPSVKAFDIDHIRNDFPILHEQINGHPLVWLDNAATTQKPQVVIDRITHFYQHENSNIHRAAHTLAARSTDAFEHARQVVARFIAAESANEIVFVRGATEAINLVAKTWGVANITADDEIILSQLEHHANIVPWYQLSQQTGAKIRVLPVDDHGQIMLQFLPLLLNQHSKLIAITQLSNVLGSITPTAEIIAIAHRHGVPVLVDAAQSIAHLNSNVQTLDADFFVFSGHKIFAPTGIGILYAKSDLLENMPVWEGGGNMIRDVSFEQISYQNAPQKFEAGTANIADAVALATALEYVETLGINNIAQHEHQLLQYAEQSLHTVPGLHIIGTSPNKAGVISFILAGHSPEQVGQILNQYGVAVRAGQHCAQPILRRFALDSTVRASLALYNNTADIDQLVAVLQQLQRKPNSFSSRLFT